MIHIESLNLCGDEKEIFTFNENGEFVAYKLIIGKIKKGKIVFDENQYIIGNFWFIESKKPPIKLPSSEILQKLRNKISNENEQN